MAGESMSTEINLEKYISAAEAAEIMKKDTSHVARLCKLGKLPGALLLGKRWFIPRESATAYYPYRKAPLNYPWPKTQR
jgi:hypothetical protein